jgi:hypothetical protein
VSRDVRELVRSGATAPQSATTSPAPDARPTQDDRSTLAELWERAQEVAREARKAEAARRHGEAAEDETEK